LRGQNDSLRLAELSERYGMGFSPLREALNRLQAERLVTAESLRGFKRRSAIAGGTP
jgi:DNA-binding GntR family transcriptional regulator